MSIESIGSLNKILKSHDAKSWASDVDFKTKNLNLEKLNLNDVSGVKPATSFTELLADSLVKVNKMQEEANTAIQKLASGESKNIHETMLTVEKADIAFKTMNQIRGKIIDAYKEIMRMQV
ncbi:MAG: flagellar hook-basal body complex protein FliE [Halobacteriovoraceae bacterium]|nr:flagellar hook-basal body complex protein FliE [Halobacteriovoraceae bacterium]